MTGEVIMNKVITSEVKCKRDSTFRRYLKEMTEDDGSVCICKRKISRRGSQV